MMRYDKIKELKGEKFRRLTGVKKKTYEKMLEILKKADKDKRAHGGRPNKLSIEDMTLMTLEYWRENRTYFHTGQSYGISESSAYKNIRWVEDTLIKSKAFSLPGKKELKKVSNYELILIERPKKQNKRWKKNKKPEKQTKKILFWEEKKTYYQNSSSCRQKVWNCDLYEFCCW